MLELASVVKTRFIQYDTKFFKELLLPLPPAQIEDPRRATGTDIHNAQK